MNNENAKTQKIVLEDRIEINDACGWLVEAERGKRVCFYDGHLCHGAEDRNCPYNQNYNVGAKDEPKR